MQRHFRITILVVAIFALFAAAPIHPFAQTSIQAQLPTALNFLVVPEYPAPGQAFIVSIQNLGPDFAQASISWTIDGVPNSEFDDSASINLTAPGGGEEMAIKALVSRPGRTTDTITATIKPANVDLFWEGSTYVPPFYKGIALPAPDSGIRIVAIPHIIENGAETDPRVLSYKWTVNDKVQLSGSGSGKNVLNTAMPHFAQPLSVKVTVTSPNGGVANAGYRIDPTDPQLFVYEDTPLLGVLFNNAIAGTFALHGSETTLRAYPFFFSLPFADTSFTWLLNNSVAESAGGSSALTLRSESGAGLANITVAATQAAQLLQSAEAAFRVSFGQ